MKVVIPMSGSGQRFKNAGYTDLKPLIKVEGVPMVQHVMNLFPGSEFVFICNSEHLETTAMREILSGKGKIVPIAPHKLGPVHTVLEGAQFIEDDEEVIVSYCDYGTKWDFDKFKSDVKGCDGGIAAYIGFHPHMLGTDHYAYMKHQNMHVTDIREKAPFGENKMEEYASNGTYYFRSGALLKHYFKKLVETGRSLNGEYYVSMVYQLMIDDKLTVKVSEIEKMLQWGTPRDLEEYLFWSNVFSKRTLKPLSRPLLANTALILPMAGHGSRFETEGYTVPKPFIPVDGKPMVTQAIECLPRTEETFIVKLKNHAIPLECDATVTEIDAVTDGQATTCSLVAKDLDGSKSILISACDNGAYYDSSELVKLITDESIDVIVWTFKTPKRFPEMYGWVQVDHDDCVTSTSIKKASPGHDHGIVGTMFFRRADVFMKGYEYIRTNEIKTNNEYYVDNIIQPLVNMKYRVKVFNVDYICWGTPNEYRTYAYWSEYFTPRLVIFDMDDTLVGYSSAHKKAMDDVFANFPEFTQNDYVQAKQVIYKRFSDSFLRHEKLLQFKQANPKRALEMYRLYRDAYMNEICLMDGVSEMVSHIPCPKVIMSNNSLLLQLEVAKKLELDVSEIFTSNEFMKEKPDAESLRYILDRYNCDPRDALIIGDSASDLEWGANNGVRVIIK